MTVLRWVLPQHDVPLQLHIHFADPWPETARRPAKSFWEHRSVTRGYTRLEPHQPELHEGVRYPKKKQKKLAYFYEYLLVPLLWSHDWRNAQITFDREIRRKSSGFKTKGRGPWNQRQFKYHGYKELALVLWDLLGQTFMGPSPPVLMPMAGPQPDIERSDTMAALLYSHTYEQRLEWERSAADMVRSIRQSTIALDPILRDFRGELAEQLRRCVLRAHLINSDTSRSHIGHIYLEWAVNI